MDGPPPADLVAGMLTLLDEEEGLGLAAPQVGVAARVLLARDEDGEPHVLANPLLLDMAGRHADWEGCLSLPGLHARVARYEEVVVEAADALGSRRRLAADGIFARVIQHEMDHLDGILIFDRAEPAGLEFEDEPIGPEEVARCFPP